MENQKVSIVVAIYNGEKYIDTCVKGLLAQTYKNVEFVLVDDGSTDKSGEMCDRYAQQDERIKVVHQPNGGLSAARNAGTNVATGDYVVYFDVDDTVTSKVVEDNVKLAVQHDADVVMFCFWYYNTDTDTRLDNAMERDFVGNSEEYFREYLIPTMDREVFNAPWNKLYKRSFLEENKLRFLPEFPIYEDIIFASKMLQYAKKIVVNKEMYYTYFVRTTGSLITKYVDGYFDSVTKFYNNAMQYCSAYTDNKKQIKRFSTLYMRLVLTNLKQISCRKALDKNTKYSLIRRICNSEEIKSAVEIAEMGGKKELVRYLIKKCDYKNIYYLYNLVNNIQGKKMQ